MFKYKCCQLLNLMIRKNHPPASNNTLSAFNRNRNIFRITIICAKQIPPPGFTDQVEPVVNQIWFNLAPVLTKIIPVSYIVTFFIHHCFTTPLYLITPVIDISSILLVYIEILCESTKNQTGLYDGETGLIQIRILPADWIFHPKDALHRNLPHVLLLFELH